MRTITLVAALFLAAFTQSPVVPVVTPQASNTTESLIGLHAVDPRVVWAGGAGGTWLRTTDGGAHWRVGVVPGAESVQFRDVHALDSLTAWMLSIPGGDSARIYHTTDGGAHWTLQFRNQDPAAFYDCFAFWDARRAIAISDVVRGRLPILLTDDGGRNWRPVLTAASPVADSGEGAPAASGTCVVAHRPGYAWIGTIGGKAGARVVRTADAGRSWRSTVTPIGHRKPGAGIFSLLFRDARRGFAAGSGDSTRSPTGRMARTLDGGRTWRLTADPTFSGTIYGLAAVPGRPAALVATGPGGSSISADDGRTWRPLDPGNFWTVQFADASTGWMVGPRGRIVKVELR